MLKQRDINLLQWLYAVFMIATILCGAKSGLAFQQGVVYDKNNYQEVKGQLIPLLLNWVENGEFILQTGTLDYDLAVDEKYQKLSQKNEGKYDVNEDGLLVHKDTGKVADFVLGDPFPTIDPKAPKLAEKVLENYKFLTHNRLEGSHSTGYIRWHSPTGLEREIISQEHNLYYQNREKGPINNPNNYLYQNMTSVAEPYELRGTVLMTWMYNDARPDTSFAYVPMLRRVRRVPASARSDPWVGSDMCVDDMMSWSGKNAGVQLKFIGDGPFLCPFGSTSKVIMKTFPDGSITRTHDVIKKGYETPGWQGIGYAPSNVTWVSRDCWVIEAIPKDPYYNYGKMIFYIDKENYALYFKEMYDRAGELWKTLMNTSSCYETDQGDRYIFLLHCMITVDIKARHASSAEVGVPKYEWFDRFKLPTEEFNDQYFTESNLRQLSK